MRGSLGLLIALGACSFQSNPSAGDGGGDARPIDGARLDAAHDAAPDAPPDAPTDGRVTAGLVGLWTFDDPNGSLSLADTSGDGSSTVLAITLTEPTLGGGTMDVAQATRAASPAKPHQGMECGKSGAVSLEAWVQPQMASEGTTAAPVLVAGLSASTVSHDIALVQAGSAWVGLARTTDDGNGGPALTSTTLPDPSGYTHLVVVVDDTQRILYVNGNPEVVGTPGPLTKWDATYRMLIANEFQSARPWLGSFALVAIYDSALSAADVAKNFAAGPNTP